MSSGPPSCKPPSRRAVALLPGMMQGMARSVSAPEPWDCGRGGGSGGGGGGMVPAISGLATGAMCDDP